MATVATNTVDIKQLPQIESIAAQDLLIIETNNGTNTIQTQNVVWGLNNTDFGQTHANAIVSLSSSLVSAQLSNAINNSTQISATLPTDLFAFNTTASPAGARSIQKKNIIWDITNTSFGQLHSDQITALSAERLEAKFDTLPYSLSGLQPTDEFIINTNNGVAQIQAISIVWPKSSTNFGQNHEDRLESIESVLLTSDSTIGIVLNYDTNTRVLEATSAINTFDIKPATIFNSTVTLVESNAAITGGIGAANIQFDGYNHIYTAQIGHLATSGAGNSRHTYIQNSNIPGTSAARLVTLTTDPNGLSNPRVALLGTHNTTIDKPIQFFGSTDTRGSMYYTGHLRNDVTSPANTNRTSFISFNSGHNTIDADTRSTRIRFQAFDQPTNKWDELNLESALGVTDTGVEYITPFISGKRRTTGTTAERSQYFIGLGAHPEITDANANITVAGVVRMDKAATLGLSNFTPTLTARPTLTVFNGAEFNGGVTANGGLYSTGNINCDSNITANEVATGGSVIANGDIITGNSRPNQNGAMYWKINKLNSSNGNAPTLADTAHIVLSNNYDPWRGNNTNLYLRSYKSNISDDWLQDTWSANTDYAPGLICSTHHNKGFDYTTRTYDTTGIWSYKVGIGSDFIDPNAGRVQLMGDVFTRTDIKGRQPGSIWLSTAWDYTYDAATRTTFDQRNNYLNSFIPADMGANVYAGGYKNSTNTATPLGVPITVPIGGSIAWLHGVDSNGNIVSGRKIPSGWEQMNGQWRNNARENYSLLVRALIQIGATSNVNNYTWYDQANNRIWIAALSFHIMRAY